MKVSSKSLCLIRKSWSIMIALQTSRLTVCLTPEAEGTHLSWEQVFEDAEIAQAVKERAGPANEQNLDRLTTVLSETRYR